MYAGEITVGMQFIWEPNDPQNRESITVVETRYGSAGFFIKSDGDKHGLCWNSLDRFREAVIIDEKES